MQQLRQIIGLAGVDFDERRSARITSLFFDWIMFFIAIFLPVIWYLEHYDILSRNIASIFHWVVWLAFTIEMTTVTLLVKRKIRYMVTNWFNLFIIIFTCPLLWFHSPLIAAMRILRYLLLFRILVSWWGISRGILARNHLGATLLVFTMIVLVVGDLISLVDPGIPNPWLGMWWAVQTITTVGYGDIVPKTVLGQFFSMIIMIMGVALISILTANFSAYLLGKKDTDKQDRLELNIQMRELRASITRLEKKLDALVQQKGKEQITEEQQQDSH